MNNPTSCKESSYFSLGVLGFVTPLRDTPVNKGYYIRSCSKGNKDFSVKHEFGHDPCGIYPPNPVIDPSPVLSEDLVVNEVLRVEYASSGFPS